MGEKTTPATDEELVPIKEQVYKDPRPIEQLQKYYDWPKTHKPTATYDLVRLLLVEVQVQKQARLQSRQLREPVRLDLQLSSQSRPHSKLVQIALKTLVTDDAPAHNHADPPRTLAAATQLAGPLRRHATGCAAGTAARAGRPRSCWTWTRRSSTRRWGRRP